MFLMTPVHHITRIIKNILQSNTDGSFTTAVKNECLSLMVKTP